MSAHTPGPWMVSMQRDAYGVTAYKIYQHTHAAICVDKASYWTPEHECITDDDGYYQPDEAMDCAPHRIANARLIAIAPSLYDVCERLLEAVFCSGKCDIPSSLLDELRAAIAEVNGDAA